jgi:hypothetical protein
MCSSILQVTDVSDKPTDNDLPSTRIQSKNNIRPIIIDQKGLEKLLANINPSGFVLLLLSPSMMFVLT